MGRVRKHKFERTNDVFIDDLYFKTYQKKIVVPNESGSVMKKSCKALIKSSPTLTTEKIRYRIVSEKPKGKYVLLPSGLYLSYSLYIDCNKVSKDSLIKSCVGLMLACLYGSDLNNYLQGLPHREITIVPTIYQVSKWMDEIIGTGFSSFADDCLCQAHVILASILNNDPVHEREQKRADCVMYGLQLIKRTRTNEHPFLALCKKQHVKYTMF